jgi:RHS repeat-associated protein
MPTLLTPAFAVRGSSSYDWETRYTGYRWDVESSLYQVRNRQYHPVLGGFLTQDPLGRRRKEDAARI